jgi:hypothetical protein
VRHRLIVNWLTRGVLVTLPARRPNVSTNQQGLEWEYQIAAGNAGWRLQFRFAVHVILPRVPELWTLGCLTTYAVCDYMAAVGYRDSRWHR